MPKFTLPDIPEMDSGADNTEPAVKGSESDNVWPYKWDRSIRIPVNAKILASLEVGKVAQVTLRGKISGLNRQEAEDANRCHLEISIASVEAYPAQEIDEEAAMSASYKESK